MLVTRFRNNSISQCGLLGGGIDEPKCIDTEISGRREAFRRWLLLRDERHSVGVLLQVFLNRSGLCCCGPARRDGLEEGVELCGRSGGESNLNVGNQNHLGALRQVELHREATRARIWGGIGDLWESRLFPLTERSFEVFLEK